MKRTPLHATTMWNDWNPGRRAAAELLLAKGSRINEKDVNGDTPLHLAACDGKLELVRLFLSKGAEVNVKDNNRQTPLDMAKQYGRVEVANLLKEHDAKEGTETPQPRP
jgi:ankyrin repeat protein